MDTVRIIQHKWNNEDRLSESSPLVEFLSDPVDLAFADPPYNYGVTYDADESRDKLPQHEYRVWIYHVIRKLASIVKDRGTLWWLCPAEDGHWTWPLLERFGVLLHGKPIIWYERFSQYQQKRLTSDYRLLFPLVVRCFDGRPNTFNPDDIRVKSVRQEMGDKRANPNGRVPGHIWQVRRLQGNAHDRVKWHPAQLPPEPLGMIVKGWTDEGDTVLDAFAGSGSMIKPCLDNGRNFVGVEASAHYCDKMKERYED